MIILEFKSNMSINLQKLLELAEKENITDEDLAQLNDTKKKRGRPKKTKEETEESTTTEVTNNNITVTNKIDIRTTSKETLKQRYTELSEGKFSNPVNLNLKVIDDAISEIKSLIASFDGFKGLEKSKSVIKEFYKVLEDFQKLTVKNEKGYSSANLNSVKELDQLAEQINKFLTANDEFFEALPLNHEHLRSNAYQIASTSKLNKLFDTEFNLDKIEKVSKFLQAKGFEHPLQIKFHVSDSGEVTYDADSYTKDVLMVSKYHKDSDFLRRAPIVFKKSEEPLQYVMPENKVDKYIKDMSLAETNSKGVIKNPTEVFKGLGFISKPEDTFDLVYKKLIEDLNNIPDIDKAKLLQVTEELLKSNIQSLITQNIESIYEESKQEKNKIGEVLGITESSKVKATTSKRDKDEEQLKLTKDIYSNDYNDEEDDFIKTFNDVSKSISQEVLKEPLKIVDEEKFKKLLFSRNKTYAQFVEDKLALAESQKREVEFPEGFNYSILSDKYKAKYLDRIPKEESKVEETKPSQQEQTVVQQEVTQQEVKEVKVQEIKADKISSKETKNNNNSNNVKFYDPETIAKKKAIMLATGQPFSFNTEMNNVAELYKSGDQDQLNLISKNFYKLLRDLNLEKKFLDYKQKGLNFEDIINKLEKDIIKKGSKFNPISDNEEIQESKKVEQPKVEQPQKDFSKIVDAVESYKETAKELIKTTTPKLENKSEEVSSKNLEPKETKISNDKKISKGDLSEIYKLFENLKSLSGPINVYGSPVNVYGSPVNVNSGNINNANVNTAKEKNSAQQQTTALNIQTDLTTLKQVEETVNNILAGINALNSQDFKVLNNLNANINEDSIKNITENFEKLINAINNFKAQLANLDNINLDGIIALISSLQQAKGQIATTQNNLAEISNTTLLKNAQQDFKALADTIQYISKQFEKFNSLNISQENLTNLAENLRFVRGEFNNFISILNMDTEAIQNLKSTVTDVSTFIGLLVSELSKLSKISNSIDKIVQNLYSLNIALLDFQQMIQKTDSADLTKLETFFNNIKALFTSLQQEMQSFANLNIDIKSLLSIINMLNNAITKTIQLLESIDNVDVSKIVPYFQQVLGVVQQLDNEVAKLGPEFGNNFKLVNEQLQSLRKLISSVDSIIKRTGKAQSLDNLTDYFDRLMQVVENLVVKFTTLNQHSSILQNISELMKNLAQAFAVADQQQQRFIRTLNGETTKSKNTINEASESFDRFTRVTPQRNGMLGFIRSIENKISNVRFGLESVISIIGGRTLYNWLIGTNQQIEVLQRSLEVTLKNIQEADLTIRRLRDYAALTPFQELEVFKSGEMLAANRMEIMRWIQVAGDLASAKRAAGTQIEDVINVLTRINAGDFGKAMIRLRQLGISLNDLRSEGLKFSKNNTYLGTTEQMLDALERIIEKRYGGLTQVLGQTVEGSISTIKDYVYQLGIDMGEGLFENFRSFLDKLKRGLNDFRNSLKFKDIVYEFNESINQFKSLVGTVIALFKPVFEYLATNLKTFASALKAFIEIKTLEYILNLITKFVNFTSVGTSALQKQNQLYKEQEALLQAIGQKLGYNSNLAGKATTALETYVATARLGPNATPQQVDEEVFAQRFKTKNPYKKQAIIDDLYEVENKLAIELTQAREALQLATQQVAQAEQQLNIVTSGLNGTLTQNVNLTEADAKAKYEEAIASQNNASKRLKEIETIQAEVVARRKLAESINTQMGTGATGWMAAVSSGVSKAFSMINMVFFMITIFTTLASVIRDLFGKQHYDAQLTVKDYERIIGQQEEELKLMESLNSTREFSKTQIDEYTKQQKSLQERYDKLASSGVKTKEVQEQLASTQQNLNIVTSALHDAYNNLHRANQQLLDIAPELSQALIDNQGNLTDETEKFKENTEAIRQNIIQRRILANSLYEAKETRAQVEIDKANKEIEESQRILALMENKNEGQLQAELTSMGGGTSVFSKIGRQFDRFVKKQFGLNTEKEDRFLKLYQYYKSSPDERNIILGEEKAKLAESRSNINENQKVIDTREQAIRKGFVVTDERGYVAQKIIDPKTQKETLVYKQKITDIDWKKLSKDDELFKTVQVAYDQYNYYLENTAKNMDMSVKDHEKTLTVISDMMEQAKENAETAAKPYELQAQIALNKANGDTTDATYLRLMKKKSDVMIESYQEVIDSMKERQRQYEQDAKTLLSTVENEDFKKLFDSGLSVDQIIEYMDKVHFGAKSVLQNPELNQAIKNLVDLAESKGAYSIDVNAVDRLNTVIGTTYINDFRKVAEVRKTIFDSLNQLLLEQEKERAQSRKATQTSLLTKLSKTWDRRRQEAEYRKEKELLDLQLKGILDGTTAWKNAIIKNDKEIKNIILGQISAISKIMKSLSGDELWEAKQKIMELKKELSRIDLEIQGKTESEILNEISSRYDPTIRLIESYRDKTFSDLQLKNIEEGSAQYEAVRKQYGNQLVETYRKQIAEIRKALPTLDAKKQTEALTTLNELTQKTNEILLDIKKAVSPIGEFNKPGNVKVLTYYDYMSKQASSNKVEIANAHFAFNIDGVNTIQELDTILNNLADHLKRNYNANITNRSLRR